MENPKIRISGIEMIPLSSLKKHPKNPNTHPADQIERLAQIIEYQGWRYPIKISRLSGYVTSGHGRMEAAELRGWTHVPVSFQEYESEEQEYADLVSDNSIAEWAELNLSVINTELGNLGPDFDLDLLGIKDFTLDTDGQPGNGANMYTKKIDAPIYEPKGECPKLTDLFDATKSNEILQKVYSANVPADVKDFLIMAAQRHLVFNYENIAEYYTHAPTEIQDLMEQSALVIIDFDKAIENGFVTLSQKLADEYRREKECRMTI